MLPNLLCIQIIWLNIVDVKGIRNVHFTKFFLSPKLKTSNDNDKCYRQRKHHSIPSELFDDDENIIIHQLTVFL